MAKRKDIEKFIKDWIYKITRSKKNVELYEDFFKSMNDKEFKEFMEQIKNGDLILNVLVPHDGDSDVKLDRNFKLAKELGYDFFQHLTVGPSEDMPKYKTPYKYMTLTLPYRRAKQTIEKGISYSEHDKSMDSMTGQPAGDSRSSRISFPETQLLVGMGIKEGLIELLRDRGGDVGAYHSLKNVLLKYGRVSDKVTSAYSDGVISTQTLKSLFNGMHLKINLTSI